MRIVHLLLTALLLLSATASKSQQTNYYPSYQDKDKYRYLYGDLPAIIWIPPAEEPIQAKKEKKVRKSKTKAKQMRLVFVCTGGSARRYHYDDYCRGLSRCSGDLLVLSEEEALTKGKTPCRICVY